MRLSATRARVTCHGQPSLIQRTIRILRDGTQGWWYDPSDMSTLFQDAAGTTPVTAVEQQVGLMLDKSRGLVLGPELAMPLTPANWTTSGANATHVATFSGGSLRYQSDTTSPQLAVSCNAVPAAVTGGVYLVTVVCSSWVSGGVKVFEQTSGALVVNGVGTYTARILAPAGSGLAITRTTENVDLTISSVSLKLISGNHATQATSTSRPILRNRYNLFTKSEDFTDTGVWATVLGGAGVTPVRVPNDAADPDGVMLADKITFNAPVSGDQSAIIQTATGLITGASYVAKAWVKAATAGDIGKTILYRSVAAAGYSTLTLTADYQAVNLTNAAAGATVDGFAIGLRPAVGGSSGTVSIHVAKASLVNAADANLPYQRVNTATDYDSDPSKFPLYLDADGSDDGMATPAFAAGSDKVTVFAAIYKATDSIDQQTIMEFGANSASTAGTFAIQSSPVMAPQIRFQLYGSSRGIRDTLNEFAAPRKMVISCAYDISGATITDEVKARINGVAPTLNAILTPAGTGNFGTHSLNLFRRNATNFPFQGRFYGGAGKFRALSDYEIATVEQYLRMKSRAY